MYVGYLQEENITASTMPYYIGISILLLGLPLLLWQAFPENQLLSSSSSGFLVAHSLMETFAVIVAALIFFTAYSTRSTVRAMHIIALGCAFLAAALFDVFHLLSYKGMPDFVSHNTPNKAILFWLGGRISVGVGLLLYILLAESRFTYERCARWAVTVTLIVVTIITYLILVFPSYFPVMFVPGYGLTDVKIIAEWLVFSIYILSAIILYLQNESSGEQAPVNNINSLMLALLLMALGELFFTMYIHVNNTANFLGHVYKVIGYYYLYRAIFAETVRLPFQRIQKRLSYDELTGLASRSAFNDELQKTIDLAQRNETTCAVILIGLDNFKTVNATLGHEQGDLLLMAVASRICDVLPERAFMARFGGDMFSVLVKQYDVHKATHMGNALLNAMYQPFKLGNDNLEISASMGVVVYPQSGETVSSLLRHADVSLHKAKSEGRRCLVVFSHEISDAINRSALISSRMKHALANNEFYLHYQPKVILSTGKIGGCEALLRWQSPELGMVAPDEFIPVAEDNGLILKIGEWVLQEACSQVKKWQAEGIWMGGGVAVNLSARQFRQKDLPEMIEAILHQQGITAADITLEITESAIMDNPDSAVTMLEQLAKLGIYTAIDDFGTGYSSLSYLKIFPIRWLKIDRTFIRDIPDDENDMAIVRSILSLGKSLGIGVVAEGVETEEQLEYLRTEQCDVIQGYLYSRPLPPEECGFLMRSGIQ